MVKKPITIQLPLASTSEIESKLRENPRQSLVFIIPDHWCYRVHRSSPPNGWDAKLRVQLRSSLFPESPAELHWDEAINDDRSWSVWALSQSRLQTALGNLETLVWTSGRKVRICPVSLHKAAPLSAFPNLAPPAHRPRRIPWRPILTWTCWVTPVLALLIAGTLLGLREQKKWKLLAANRAAAEQDIKNLQGQVETERKVLAVLKRMDSSSRENPLWLSDMDALTRLLPEDTRLTDLQWQPDDIQIVLITPRPEIIRDILEGSPDFKNVRFLGNLERQKDKSKLTLRMEPKVAR